MSQAQEQESHNQREEVHTPRGMSQAPGEMSQAQEQGSHNQGAMVFAPWQMTQLPPSVVTVELCNESIINSTCFVQVTCYIEFCNPVFLSLFDIVTLLLRQCGVPHFEGR